VDIKYTSTPWTTSAHSEYPNRTQEIKSGDVSIADVGTSDDAAFIVRACNAHEPMLEALRQAKAGFAILGRQHPKYDGIKQDLAVVEAAIAKAEAA
jgi:hypothetical protein